MPERDRSLIYSSGPGGAGSRCPKCGWPIESCACSKNVGVSAGPLAAQRVRVQRSSAGRGGKTVTLVTGIEGGDGVLSPLVKKMKTRCGAGGTVRGETIEIQGDHVDTLLSLLSSEGYRPKKSGG